MRNTLFYTRNIFVNIRTQIHLFACLHLVAFPPCISILGIQPLSKCVLWCFAILPWCVVWSFYLGVYFLLAVLIRINERMISPLELWKTTYWPNPSCHEVSPKLAVRLAESWTCMGCPGVSSAKPMCFMCLNMVVIHEGCLQSSLLLYSDSLLWPSQLTEARFW